MTCGQIEDLKHLFFTCEHTKLVWTQFTPNLKKIIPGETLTGTKALLLRNFQTKHPKRATTPASYLIKMILRKPWTSRCASLFDKKQTLAQGIISQIRVELRQRISNSFSSNETDISKQMFTWRRNNILCSLDKDNKLVFKI